MSEARPDQDRLTDEAIDLVIRLQNDPENLVAIEMVRAWRARGPEHERIWARVAKVHGAAGKILTDRRRAKRRESLGLTRRNFVIGGAIGLGAIGTGYSLLPDILIRSRADHITGKGEIRRVSLPDGSVATLGPDSAIAVDFAAQRRRIELLAGMSFFDVASEPQRPFSVQMAELTATALGTAFDVSNDAGMLSVVVDHGVVETRAPSSPLATGARLQAGEWVTFDRSTHAVERGSREASQIASWRDNFIIAEKEAVSALVARIGRWIPGRIVMADPFIGAQRVSGIFDLNDPKRALEAVVHPAGARVRQVSTFLTVISPL
ncbi:transmembrane sensor [Bradyrhizobium sp. AZCC 1610]|uniref:FecR family protein n=1 Tax=Bradyrhizobium sp. AZCC 1610 TaxID=3117020 RepID=UPI002FEEAE1B